MSELNYITFTGNNIISMEDFFSGKKYTSAKFKEHSYHGYVIGIVNTDESKVTIKPGDTLAYINETFSRFVKSVYKGKK
jgi:hypothetical protein